MKIEPILLLDDYQAQSNHFINKARHPDPMDGFTNTALGLTGESGEFADIIKKVKYHGHPLDEETRLKLAKELGDVLWYVSEGCKEVGMTLSEVATLNIQKLSDRHKGTEFSESSSINKNEAEEAIQPALFS